MPVSWDAVQAANAFSRRDINEAAQLIVEQADCYVYVLPSEEQAAAFLRLNGRTGRTVPTSNGMCLAYANKYSHG